MHEHDAKIEHRRGREGEEEQGARGIYRSVLLPDNLKLIASCEFGP